MWWCGGTNDVVVFYIFLGLKLDVKVLFFYMGFCFFIWVFV